MSAAPHTIGEARVLAYTPIDDRDRPTGNCKHIVGGELLQSPAGIAICRYPGEEGYHLFYCDANWELVTDTWHQSLEDAEAQAEFEYRGTSATWSRVA